MDVDRSKTAWRGDQKATKKGRSGGLLDDLQSEGRERRRRRAEDVGVVLGEAARVRHVGLFHQVADVKVALQPNAKCLNIAII